MQGSAATALVLGAVSRDVEISDTSESTSRPGGVVSYAGTTLARLGASTRVVTRVHESDAIVLLNPLEAEGVEVLALPSRATTRYILDYSGRVDRHQLCETSDPIRPADVPTAWRSADLVHLGPLHRRDIEPATVSVLRGLIGIDLQGLVREPGAVRDIPEMLQHVTVVQVSESELPMILEGAKPESLIGRAGVREAIITRGERGATVLTRDGTVEIPAHASQGAHPIGAGDVFLASYLLSRVRGLPPERAGQAAARVCAAKIDEGQVPKGFDLAPSA